MSTAVSTETPAVPPSQSATEPSQSLLSKEAIARYKKAASQIGIHLVSISHATRTGNPRSDFLNDHASFMNDIRRPYKVRRLGGADIDIYALYKAVLERGGLQNVITTRAFKLVARTLMLPRSCTSAAFILRVEYEKILYPYEQRHVCGTMPLDSNPLLPAPRNRRSYAGLQSIHRPSTSPSPLPQPSLAIHPLQKPARPRRQAALAATTAVAAAVSDDPYNYPLFPRKRLTGLDDIVDDNLVENEIINDNAPHGLYVPGQSGERERVVSALWSPIADDVAWALGTLNALSFDIRNLFVATEFHGVLEGLHQVLNRHLEDVLKKRRFGVENGLEMTDDNAPRDRPMPAMNVQHTGYMDTGAGVGVTNDMMREEAMRSSSLQQYSNLFNLADPISIDREQCAVVATNVLRNMSFYDRNAIHLANSPPILQISAHMIRTVDVPANLREGLIDMWINVSPYLDASKPLAGNVVLKTCIDLLDPFREGSDLQHFTNCGEVFARLAASPERNEAAIVATFDETLPRLVDMLGGRNRRYINAGLAALCNLSAFDWPARDSIARVPRALERLVCMLPDPEFAPRAALTLLNLAEAPNNRAVMLAFENRFVELAMTPTPAADTLASMLFDLSHD